MEYMEIVLLSLLVFFFILQVIFIFIFSKTATYQPKEIDIKEEIPITIVVVARNEYHNLVKLVPALLAQVYAKYEIILVNDRSDDETYDYFLSLKDQHENLRLMNVENVPDYIHPKKYAITLAVKAAKYEHILFTDADCLPLSNQWISKMAAAYQVSPAIDFVLGISTYRAYKGWLNLFIRYETFFTYIQYTSLAIIGLPYMGVGRNLSYKKSVFLNNKGFNKHQAVPGGDDDLFVNRLANGKNTVVVLEKDSQTISEPKLTFHDWIAQKKRHLAAGKHYKFSSKLLLSIFPVSNAGLWIVFILNIVFELQPEIASALFATRIIGLTTVFYFTGKKTGNKLPILAYILLDFIYLPYYVIVGIAALTTKEIKWK
jgi:glycosyltransferase involved in cell wall biosynthesis